MAQTELFTKGLAELKAGRYAEAKRLFTENEAKLGTTAATLALLKSAEANAAAGKVDVAAKEFQDVIERNPAIAEGYLGLARIAIFTGQLDDARTHATAAVKMAPQNPMSWTLLGLVHEAKGDVAGAMPNLEKGAQLGNNVYLAQYNMGRLLTSEKKAGQGVVFLLRATELEPKNADGWIALGIAQHQLKQFDKAISSLERATKAAPKNPDPWATMADLQFGQKQFKAARATLDAALSAVGDHPALLEKAIATAMMLNDADAAVAYVERELNVVPDYEQGWLNLAHLSLLTGNLDRSEEAARELLKLDPQNWEAWFHLGNLYDAVPDEAKAVDAYKKSLAIAPDNWRVLMNLATTLLQGDGKAKWEEAKKLLEKALPVAPAGDFRVKYNLALAHVRLGDRAAALALAKEIQQHAPASDPMVAEAKKLESNLLEKN